MVRKKKRRKIRFVICPPAPLKGGSFSHFSLDCPPSPLKGGSFRLVYSSFFSPSRGDVAKRQRGSSPETELTQRVPALLDTPFLFPPKGGKILLFFEFLTLGPMFEKISFRIITKFE